MYAYLSKGGTAGHVIARLILREITGFPGFVLDCFFALFWMPDYMSYWAKNSESVEFSDGTVTTSVMRGTLGWIGEIAGYIIGAPLGAMVGLALFIPDLLLRGFIFLHQQIRDSLSDFATFIGKTQLFYNLGAYPYPQGYMEKSWNIGLAVFGITLGAIPYAAAKIIDFLLPFLELSSVVAELSTGIGGFLGWTAGLVLATPIYFLHKFTELLEVVRNTARDAVALIYACGNERVTPDGYDDCCDPGVLHSPEFVAKVNQYENSSWGKLLFGPFRNETTDNTHRKPRATESHQGAHFSPLYQHPSYAYSPHYQPPTNEDSHYSPHNRQ